MQRSWSEADVDSKHHSRSKTTSEIWMSLDVNISKLLLLYYKWQTLDVYVIYIACTSGHKPTVQCHVFYLVFWFSGIFCWIFWFVKSHKTASNCASNQPGAQDDVKIPKYSVSFQETPRKIAKLLHSKKLETSNLAIMLEKRISKITHTSKWLQINQLIDLSLQLQYILNAVRTLCLPSSLNKHLKVKKNLI